VLALEKQVSPGGQAFGFGEDRGKKKGRTQVQKANLGHARAGRAGLKPGLYK
jgi:hypothetical protein